MTLVLAGCGSDSSAGPASPQPVNPGTKVGDPRAWKLADILRLSGIRRGPDGRSYQLASHPDCTALVLLRSSAEVQTYLDSGDVVVANPDRSAGVKVNGQSAACQRLFAAGLAKVR